MLPTGTVTFLMSDIESSTALLGAIGARSSSRSGLDDRAETAVEHATARALGTGDTDAAHASPAPSG